MHILIIILFFNHLQGALRIEVNQGHFNPLPIAIIACKNDTLQEPLQKVIGIIGQDLKFSGFFKIIKVKNFLKEEYSFSQPPPYQEWRVLQTQALLLVDGEQISNNKIKIKVQLYDVLSQKSILLVSFSGTLDQLRRISHKVSNKVYERLTGEKGYFDSHVIYVQEQGSQTNVDRRLVLMDYDGQNAKSLQLPSKIVLSPQFSNNAYRVAYLDFGKNNRSPHVYLLDLLNQKRKIMGQFNGMSYAPRFSPNNFQEIIFSLSKNGNSSIYKYNLTTKALVRLTHGPFLDTSPCYSPDGSMIVFNSNRGGKPHLYVMKSDGSDIKRISFGEGKYSSPVWSPRGDLIAFVKIYGGSFFIGLMSPNGEGERLIVRDYQVENPGWCPNGRQILFTKRKKGGFYSKLFLVDMTGHYERKLNTIGNASFGCWSNKE